MPKSGVSDFHDQGRRENRLGRRFCRSGRTAPGHTRRVNRHGAHVAGAGLGLAVLVLAPAVAALAAAGGAPSTAPRPAIVAVAAAAATATVADGSSRTELPWLLPGDTDPAVAPDGRHLAFSSERDGNPEIYVADAATGAVLRLTRNLKAADRRPAWSPNGRRLVWQSGRPGSLDLFVMDADGGRKQRLVGGAGDDIDPDWSPDGKRVAFSSNRGGHRDLWVGPGRRWRAGAAARRARRGARARVEPRRAAARLQRRRRGQRRHLGGHGGRLGAATASRGAAPPTCVPTGRRTAVASHSAGR